MIETWIIPDIHGMLDKLKKCIESVDIKEGDRIIFLGDLVDRGPDSYGVVEYCIELSKKYQCIFCRGNHDALWLDYITGAYPNALMGAETLASYEVENVVPQIHMDFFKNQVLYFIDEDKNLFVHGGFNRHQLIEEQNENVLIWDRDLLMAALSYNSMKTKDEYPFKIKGYSGGQFKEIFIGHTPVQHFDSTVPINAANIWALDTGAPFKGGLLTIMNLETKEIFQA